MISLKKMVDDIEEFIDTDAIHVEMLGLNRLRKEGKLLDMVILVGDR